MIKKQETMILSEYTGIYDLVVPKDNMLRKINELIDFSFVYDELLDKYCINNGRNAIDPIRMFKYLLLKSIFDLSDVDIVERYKNHISFLVILISLKRKPLKIIHLLLSCNLIFILFHKNLFNYLLSLKV